MSRNTTTQHQNKPTLAGTSISQCPEKSIDRYVIIDDERFAKMVQGYTQAGFFEILPDYRPDPESADTFIYADIRFCSVGEPSYFVHLSNLNRFYTCKDFEALNSLIVELRSYLTEKVSKGQKSN